MPDQPSAPQPKRLYVICHGAIAMLQTDQNLVLMIPDLGSKHSYRVGTWLAETTIEKGSLMVLENVTGGKGLLPNLLNNIQNRSNTTPVASTAAKAPYATFVLPRPIQVWPLFQAIISKDALAPSSAASADLTASYVPILEYSYLSAPRLGNVWPVDPNDLQGLPDSPLTLHIYAEDEIEIDDTHAVDAFNLSCQLLGLNISLLPPPATGPLVSQGQVGKIPPGLENRCFEFQPLDLRRTALLAITKAKQNKVALTDPWGSLNCSDLQSIATTFFWGPPSPVPDVPGLQSHRNASCLTVGAVSGQDSNEPSH